MKYVHVYDEVIIKDKSELRPYLEEAITEATGSIEGITTKNYLSMLDRVIDRADNDGVTFVEVPLTRQLRISDLLSRIETAKIVKKCLVAAGDCNLPEESDEKALYSYLYDKYDGKSPDTL